MEQPESDQQRKNKPVYSLDLNSKIISGSLIGVSLIILQDLVSIGTLDVPLHTSVMAFSIALPCLVIKFIESGFKTNIKIAKLPLLIMDMIWSIIGIIGGIAAFIGIAAAFWHITPEAGQAFIGTSIVTAMAFSLYVRVRTKDRA